MLPPAQIPGAEQSHLIPPLVPTGTQGSTIPAGLATSLATLSKVSQAQEDSQRDRALVYKKREPEGAPDDTSCPLSICSRRHGLAWCPMSDDCGRRGPLH